MESYKVIVAGSRSFNDYELAFKYLDKVKLITECMKKSMTIVSGMARGADSIGVDYAKSRGLNIIEMPADWNKYGKSAGYRRNLEMGKLANSAMVFWDGESKGSEHMINIMNELNKPVWVILYNKSKGA